MRARSLLALGGLPLVAVVTACLPGGTAADAGPVCTELFAYGLTVTVTDDAPPEGRAVDG